MNSSTTYTRTKPTFPEDCRRAKEVFGGGYSPMTHRTLAFVLGIAPSRFRVMEARDAFPWRKFYAVVCRFRTEVDFDINRFPEVTALLREQPNPSKTTA